MSHDIVPQRPLHAGHDNRWCADSSRRNQTGKKQAHNLARIRNQARAAETASICGTVGNGCAHACKLPPIWLAARVLWLRRGNARPAVFARLRRMIIFCRFLTALAATLILLPTISVSAQLDPGRVNWSALQFHASKFLVSIDANVGVSDVPADETDALLMDAGEGTAVAAADSTKALTFTTEFFGRKSRADVLLNAADGATLQRTSHDSGKRNRHRIYRYTDIGAYQRTWWPVNDAEEDLPTDQWEQWSKFEEGMRPFPEAIHGEPVADPGSLLYIVGTAPLNEAGDKIEILAYARSNVHRVQVEVAGMETIKVNYEQTGGAAPGKKKGKVQALKLMLRGEMIDDGDDDDQFELLGLRGDIDIHIDPVTRAPMQLEGNVKIAGHAVMRLTHLELED